MIAQFLNTFNDDVLMRARIERSQMNRIKRIHEKPQKDEMIVTKDSMLVYGIPSWTELSLLENEILARADYIRA